MNSIGLYRLRVCSGIFSDNEHFRLIARFHIVDWLYLLQATVLGIVEGLTEFLPISSTGHLIIASDLVGFAETPGADEFVVAIQSGAILAVCWYYRERIWAVLRGLTSSPKEQRLAVNTVVAFLPAAVSQYEPDEAQFREERRTRFAQFRGVDGDKGARCGGLGCIHAAGLGCPGGCCGVGCRFRVPAGEKPCFC